VSLVAHEVETDPGRLRRLAERAKRLAQGVHDPETKARLAAAAAEYEQRAKEIEMDEGTGQ
jgi:hypothetical protein